MTHLWSKLRLPSKQTVVWRAKHSVMLRPRALLAWRLHLRWMRLSNQQWRSQTGQLIRYLRQSPCQRAPRFPTILRLYPSKQKVATLPEVLRFLRLILNGSILVSLSLHYPQKELKKSFMTPRSWSRRQNQQAIRPLLLPTLEHARKRYHVASPLWESDDSMKNRSREERGKGLGYTTWTLGNLAE